jgi:hypothetical protein
VDKGNFGVAMSGAYKPYEEWWQESVFCDDFAKEISQHAVAFSSNMANLSEIEPRTRQDWMERFVLWMEFENKNG